MEYQKWSTQHSVTTYMEKDPTYDHLKKKHKKLLIKLNTHL